jgi:hypothetical protein
MPSVKKRAAKRTPAKKPAAKKRSSAAKPAKRAAASPLARVREICLALPQAQEIEAWGTPTFRVNNKIFAMYSEGTHHSAGRIGLWMMSVSVEQDFVLRARPDKYFKPPYVGPSGWIGAWLDQNPPWAEIAELIRDAYRRRAPKKLASLVD